MTRNIFFESSAIGRVQEGELKAIRYGNQRTIKLKMICIHLCGIENQGFFFLTIKNDVSHFFFTALEVVSHFFYYLRKWCQSFFPFTALENDVIHFFIILKNAVSHYFLLVPSKMSAIFFYYLRKWCQTFFFFTALENIQTA